MGVTVVPLAMPSSKNRAGDAIYYTGFGMIRHLYPCRNQQYLAL